MSNVDVNQKKTETEVFTKGKLDNNNNNKMIVLAFIAFFVMEAFAQVDPCGLFSCYNGGTCEKFIPVLPGNTVNSCKCKKDWSGYRCERGTCSSDSRCYNGGTCIGTQCRCPREYFGYHCEKRKTGCDSNPCFNGGRCEYAYDIFFDDYNCRCPKHYYGKFCIENEDCLLVKCSNGGSCHIRNNLVRSWRDCSCPKGYYGAFCEHVNTCYSMSPCVNGGTCRFDERQGSYECQCPSDYEGIHCEEKKTECDYQPCLNGGTCVYDHSEEDYHCNCPKNYFGDTCTDRVSCSDDAPCLNGGTCGTPNGFLICRCSDSYYGGFCEHVKPCLSSPCQNGGTCDFDEIHGSYKCQCPAGYNGTHCEEPPSK